MTKKANPVKAGEKPRNPPILSNRQAAQIVVDDLTAANLLSAKDAARIQIVLNLASMVDALPENPALWREYRAAEKALREETQNDGDPFDALIKSLSAEVRNEAKPKAQKQG